MPNVSEIFSASRGTQLQQKIDRFRIESSLNFSLGRIEIREYTWSQSILDTFSFDDSTCAINYALTTRPAPTKITSLDIGPHAQPERVNRTLVIYPGSTLKLDTPKGTLRSMLCILDINQLEKITGSKLEWNNPGFRDTVSHAIPDVEWVLDNIYREMTSNKAMREFAIESFANILFIRLFRHASQCIERQASPYKGGLAPAQLRTVRARIAANDQPAPTLPELAGLCGISVRHLSRSFKQSTGQTIGKYIESVTVERAFSMLKETSQPVESIARHLGYSGATSFSCAFKRVTGFRPSDIDRPAS